MRDKAFHAHTTYLPTYVRKNHVPAVSRTQFAPQRARNTPEEFLTRFFGSLERQIRCYYSRYVTSVMVQAKSNRLSFLIYFYFYFYYPFILPLFFPSDRFYMFKLPRK